MELRHEPVAHRRRHRNVPCAADGVGGVRDHGAAEGILVNPDVANGIIGRLGGCRPGVIVVERVGWIVPPDGEGDVRRTPHRLSHAPPIRREPDLHVGVFGGIGHVIAQPVKHVSRIQSRALRAHNDGVLAGRCAPRCSMIILIGSGRQLPAHVQEIGPPGLIRRIAAIVGEAGRGRRGRPARHRKRAKVRSRARVVAVAKVAVLRMIELRGDDFPAGTQAGYMIVIVVGIVPVAVRMIRADHIVGIEQTPMPATGDRADFLTGNRHKTGRGSADRTCANQVVRRLAPQCRRPAAVLMHMRGDDEVVEVR